MVTNYTNYNGEDVNVTIIYDDNNEVIISKYIDSKHTYISYFKWINGEKCHHRDGDLPASISYKNGKISYEVWYKNDFYHRDNYKPAMIFYDKKGRVESKSYYQKGREIKVPIKHRKIEKNKK
jgi:antitoxin component YwqK of YwqJK toxin-antitoxin module